MKHFLSDQIARDMNPIQEGGGGGGGVFKELQGKFVHYYTTPKSYIVGQEERG